MQYDELGREIRGNATVFKTRQQPAPMECDTDYQPTAPRYVAPEPPAPTDFDIAPCDAIAQLQRDALPVLSRMTQAVTEAENALSTFETMKPVETLSLCRRLVDTGVFHTDKKGLNLVYTIQCNGHEHMKHLMSNGELSPKHYRTVDIQKSGTSTQRIFMLHESVKQLSDLYQHPDLLEHVSPILERQHEALQRVLAEKRLELSEYKASTKRRLQQLEKRFKAMLD